MENPTLQLVALVRAAHGGAQCTDYRIATLLKVRQSAVIRWKTGVGQMSDSLVTVACQEAGIKDTYRWRAFVGAERERGPEGDHWRQLREDFRRIDAGLQPREDGELYMLVKGLKDKVASILLAGIVGVGLSAPTPSEAYAVQHEGDRAAVYIMTNRRRKLWPWLKNRNAWPLLPQWTARNRCMGSYRPRNWLHSLAAI